MSDFELVGGASQESRSKVVDDSWEVEARLKDLHPDLNLQFFFDVVASGLAARNEATPASAPTAAGLLQWLRTVEVLRARLARLTWHLHQQKNCPFATAPDKSVSVVVMTGNSDTGKRGFCDPTNQAEKGVVAEKFVVENSRQLELFDMLHELVERGQRGTQVWALLYHYDKTANEARFELSLPTHFSKRKITKWGERLIIGSIPNNPAEFTIRRDEPNAPAKVEVEPKSETF